MACRVCTHRVNAFTENRPLICMECKTSYTFDGNIITAKKVKVVEI